MRGARPPRQPWHDRRGRHAAGDQRRLVEHQVPAVRPCRRRPAAARAQGSAGGDRHQAASGGQGRRRDGADRRDPPAARGSRPGYGAGPARGVAGRAAWWRATCDRPPRRAWWPGLRSTDPGRRCGAGAARAAGAPGAAAPAEQSGADPGRSARGGRRCPRSRASTPRSIAAIPRSPTGSRSPTAGTGRACAATASTACPTSTSPAACASSTRRWPRAGWWSATWARAPRCARSGTAAASTARWASPPSTACRWAPAPASSTPAWSSTCCRPRASTPRGSSASSTTRAGSRACPGVSNDMRDLLASDAPGATRAVDYFVYRIVREAGALAAAMGGIDGIVFTAGIGERSPEIRGRVLAGLGWLGVELDAAANAGHGPLLSTAASRLKAYVDPDRRGADDRPAHPRFAGGHVVVASPAMGERSGMITLDRALASLEGRAAWSPASPTTSRSPGAAPRRSAAWARSWRSPTSTRRPSRTSSRWPGSSRPS